jgi:hypothetical protein
MAQCPLFRHGGVILGAALLGAAPVAAQRLAPAAAEERCNGLPVVAIELRSVRREPVDRRFGAAAAMANRLVFSVQPPTREWLVRRFLLLRPGQSCDEQRRVESERILRAQSYISDVAIRAIPDSAGGVRLLVETIDEIVLYAEAWGFRGVPVGFELGTGNVGGTGRTFRFTGELGRGGALGGGIRLRETQLLGRPIILDAVYSNRPLVRTRRLVVERPFLTNFQRDAWFTTIDDDVRYYTFRDPGIRDVSLEYRRVRWELSFTRQVAPPAGRLVLGLTAQGERADGVRSVLIRDDGPIPVPTPDPLKRYGAFSSARIGVTVGARRYRFLAIRGLGALSAPEDVPLGAELFASALTGLPAWQRDGQDNRLQLTSAGAVGSAAVHVRWRATASWTSPRGDVLPAQWATAVRTGLSIKRAEGDRTALFADATTLHRERLPTQLTFRGDDDGLIGWRSTNLGGSRRFVVGVEQRQRVPSPAARTEMAVAAVAQAGRLDAGDAPYGTSTGWRSGVGAALLLSMSGARQLLRIEFGTPLDPIGGQQRTEWRFVYSDFTRRF